MKFWADLRRRRVIRMAGLYIVGAWVIFQIADIFFPAWGIPDSALRYLLYAATLCFPVALVFSWYYDITPYGITKTRKAGADESIDFSLKRKDYLVLAGLLLVAGTVIYNNLNRVVQSVGDQPVVSVPASEKPPNSLAVLPFENLDTNEQTGFFSDGVSEEILHRLASIRTLKVIGRQSSFAFGGADMGLDKISDILGVRYLLNGSIRRAGDQVRVTAPLVDDSGFQVWSESFDGDLKGIFKFQSEIAEKVASEITRELIVLKSPVAAQITESTEAYRYYLIGREYFNRRPDNWEQQAAEAYRNSIAADPEYAPPYAGLSVVIRMGAGSGTFKEIVAEAERLIERSLELDPLLAEGWMAKGLPNMGDPDFDFEEAIRNLEYALELNPNLASAYNWLAICFNRINDSEGMDRARQRGLSVDPLHPVLLMNSADSYLAQNDFEGWKREIMRLLDLPEPPTLVYMVLSSKHQEYGFLSEALKLTKQHIRLSRVAEAVQNLPQIIYLYDALGMPEMADYWLERYKSHEVDLIEFNIVKGELAILRGQFDEFVTGLDWVLDEMSVDVKDPPGFLVRDIGILLSLKGDFEAANLLLERYLNPDQPVTDINNNSDEIFLIHLLALNYEKAGQQEKAITMLNRAEQITANMLSLGNFVSYPDNQLSPALNFAARGDPTSSAQALRTAFEAGWRNYYSERHWPTWRGAWESEEFVPVVADIVTAIEQQRAEVEAIEADHDFRVEFEALISDQ